MADSRLWATLIYCIGRMVGPAWYTLGMDVALASPERSVPINEIKD